MADAPPRERIRPPGVDLPREVVALRPLLRAIVARTLGQPVAHADVDDAVAETLRRVVEGIDRLRPGEPLGAWATGIAKHVAIDALRKRRREARRHAEDDAEVDAVDPGAGPERAAITTQRLTLLEAALRDLDDGPRQAVLAFHVEGQSYEVIGARLGVPLGTVATWIARSRRSITTFMQEHEERSRR